MRLTNAFLALASTALLAATGCEKAPIVNVNAGGTGTGVTLQSAYEVDEGSSLDLVIDTGVAGATISAQGLPTGATLKDGIFSFTPDYTQAGLYSVVFTITAGTTVTVKTIGIRVDNVIHVPSSITMATEGSPAPVVTLKSDDPAGTVVVYTVDLTNAPNAIFDPVANTISWTPGFSFLDTASSSVVPIIVTAQGQEVDTGKMRTSTSQITYQVTEATSFQQELLPLFAVDTSTATSNPNVGPLNIFDTGHGCARSGCHSGSNPVEGMDFSVSTNIYTLLRQPISPSTANMDACFAIIGSDTAWQRVAPGDLNHSLWYWKIAGTNPDPAADPTTPPCGAQMPNQVSDYYWTVDNVAAWDACTNDACRGTYNCMDSDRDCKLNTPLVRKARLWILAGADNN